MIRYLLCSFLGLLAFLPARAQERPLVVATASIFADMAAVIGGELVEVRTVVPIGGDPHIYEPSPGDARLINRADLVLRNGLTFEGWLNELIENSGTSAEVVTITEGIDPIESDTYANSADPHAWMSVPNGLTYIRNIRDALIRLDPDNADIYQFNHDLYRQQLTDLDTWIRRQIDRLPERHRLLITSHDAFRYYGREYGIRVEAALGTSTDADVQTSDIKRLTDIIRSTGVPAIFVESTINPKLIRQIAEDNGVIVGGSLYADSLSDPESPAGTYPGMLRYNTTTIVQALLGRSEALHDHDRPSERQRLWLLISILAIMAGSFAFMVIKLNASV